MIENLNPEEKRQRVKDAFNSILSLNRQKTNLTNDLNNYFSELKHLGYPRAMISRYMKKLTKTKFEIESDEILFKEFELFIEE